MARIGQTMAIRTNAAATMSAIPTAGSIARRRPLAAGSTGAVVIGSSGAWNAGPARCRSRVRCLFLWRRRGHLVLEALGQGLARLAGSLEVVLDEVDLLEVDRCLVHGGIRV